MSNFQFISDTKLRSNVDKAFDFVVHLVLLTETSQSNTREEKLVNNFYRKTIILYTASIVEAILVWKLGKYLKENNQKIKGEWKYKNWRKICIDESGDEVGASSRLKEEITIHDLDFSRVIQKCKKHEIINTSSLENEVDELRKVRNNIHIGGLEKIESTYTKERVENFFEIAGKVKKRIIFLEKG
ncbi:MAG: hypothetical protein OEX81_05825 [Candidatus Pacebacteria bacterium]|nr:hypothetical protein [Candidatus Paceibacterota bacterium]